MSTLEEIRYDGQQQDREDKRREMLERRARMGGPDAPDACEDCDDGEVMRISSTLPDLKYRFEECPRCLGSKVQP